MIIALGSWLVIVNNQSTMNYFKNKDDILMLKYHMKYYKKSNNLKRQQQHESKDKNDDNSDSITSNNQLQQHHHHYYNHNYDKHKYAYLYNDFNIHNNTESDQLLSNHKRRSSLSLPSTTAINYHANYNNINLSANNGDNNRNNDKSNNNHDKSYDYNSMNENSIDDDDILNEIESHTNDSAAATATDVKKHKNENNFVILALINAFNMNDESLASCNESSLKQKYQNKSYNKAYPNKTTLITEFQRKSMDINNNYNINQFNNNNDNNQQVCNVFQNEQRFESFLLCSALMITIWSSIFQAAFFAYIKSSSPSSSIITGHNIEQTLYFSRLLSDFVGRPLTFLPRPFFVKVILYIYIFVFHINNQLLSFP